MKLIAVMLYVSAIILFCCSLVLLTSCTKKKELSQEEQERSTLLAPNQLIENEHGGIRFFITNGKAQVTSSIPVFSTVAYENYFIEADKMPENSSIILEFTGSTSFDLLIEGFTAPPYTMGKRIEMRGLLAGTKLKLSKGIVLYTVTKL